MQNRLPVLVQLAVCFMYVLVVKGWSRCRCLPTCCGNDSLCGSVMSSNWRVTLLTLILLTMCRVSAYTNNTETSGTKSPCDYPLVPRDLDCRNFNFETMNCTWKLGVQYVHEFDMNISCRYINISEHDVKIYHQSGQTDECLVSNTLNFTACPQGAKEWCFWDEDTFKAGWKFLIMVIVNNTKRSGDIAPKVSCKEFDPNDIVEPAPVDTLSVLQAEEKNCLTLQWSFDKASRNYVFNVTYTSECTEPASQVVYNIVNVTSYSKHKNVTICGLNPYTNYTFSVKRRLVKETEKGYWSEWTNVSYMTQSDVIKHPPETYNGLYELTDVPAFEQEEQRALTLYWKPIEDCHLHANSASVTYTVQTDNGSSSVPHPFFAATVHVQARTVYDIQLSVNNSEGSTESEFKIYSDGPVPSELLIEYNQTGNVCNIYATVTIKSESLKFTRISHTVVRCIGNQLNCSSPPEWQHLDQGVTSSPVFDNHCGGYRYGLITHGYVESQGDNATSGIRWQPCVYQLNTVPKTSVSVALAKVQPDGGFSVEWEPYDCQITKVYILYYVIKYCQTSDLETCKCTTEPVFVNVSKEEDTFTVTGLGSGTQFCVWVAGLSKSGLGPFSEAPVTHIIVDLAGSKKGLMVGIGSGAVFFIATVLLVVCSVRKRIKKFCHDSAKISVPDDAERYFLPQQNGVHSTQNGYGHGILLEPLTSQEDGTTCTSLINPEDSEGHTSETASEPKIYKFETVKDKLVNHHKMEGNYHDAGDLSGISCQPDSSYLLAAPEDEDLSDANPDSTVPSSHECNVVNFDDEFDNGSISDKKTEQSKMGDLGVKTEEDRENSNDKDELNGEDGELRLRSEVIDKNIENDKCIEGRLSEKGDEQTIKLELIPSNSDVSEHPSFCSTENSDNPTKCNDMNTVLHSTSNYISDESGINSYTEAHGIDEESFYAVSNAGPHKPEQGMVLVKEKETVPFQNYVPHSFLYDSKVTGQEK